MDRRAAGQWVAIVALALACAGLGWFVGHRALLPAERAPPPGVAVVAPGEALPPMPLARLRGRGSRDLAGPGRVRLVNFWASWCGPCREEMPVLDAFAARQGPDGVEVIGVALDDADDARAFLAEVPVAFELLVEPNGPGDSSVRLGNARGVLPYTVLVDAQGRLQRSHYGAFPDPDAVRAWLGE